jgi:peptide deformylase
MKIISVPHPILNQETKVVLKIDKKLKRLVKEMIELLNKQTDPPGVGLAAPQVGIPLQLFVIKPTAKSLVKAFINPKIVKISYNQSPPKAELVKSVKKNKTDLTDSNRSVKRKPISTKLEGCLSIPKIWGSIKRGKKILLEYQTIEGQKKTEWFSGFAAIIIQHEVDHLKGILFTQRILEQEAVLYEEKEGKLIKKEI